MSSLYRVHTTSGRQCCILLAQRQRLLLWQWDLPALFASQSTPRLTKYLSDRETRKAKIMLAPSREIICAFLVEKKALPSAVTAPWS